MGVNIIEKLQKSGNKSLVLDINYNNRRKKEYLNIVIKKGNTPQIRAENKSKRLLAEEIRAKREIEIISHDYEIKDKSKKNLDFILFFEQYSNEYPHEDKRLVTATYKKFKSFLSEKLLYHLPLKNITKELCQDFKDHLDENLKGETPYDYFKKFRSVLNKAVDKGYITKNPAKDVKNIRILGLKKSILTPDEVQILANTYCSNDDVKRAFLFCLNTGLRLCDVKALKWKQIADGKLIYTQKKVDKTSAKAQVTVDLNDNASKLIGVRSLPDELIFNLPTTTNGCNKVLKSWVNKAEIEKHITWHCARHSIAVTLLSKEYGNADIATVAGLLGHSSFKSTEIYSQYISERGKKAINNLPIISLK
jgi:integrase